jgi:hypothetical protein
MINAGQVWQIASAWVDWIAAGLEKNSDRPSALATTLAE